MDLPVNNNSQQELQEQLERATSIEEQKDNEPVKLTPEQEEEIKLRSKYPNPQKPGGSAFIQKMLHKGSKKYFDSGDYNMAKSKNRALNNTARQQQQQQPTQIQLNVQNNNTSSDVDITSTTTTASIDVQQLNDSNNKLNIINEDTLNNSTTSNNQISNYSSSSSCQSPVITNNNNSLNISANSASLQSSPSIQNNNNNYHHLSTSNQASPLMTSQSSSVGLTSSISSSSLSMHLNPSVSLDKLSNINPMLDSEEIGHGIPTPECLPQSRKHSIAQSKLATPRVSSS